MKYSDEFRKKDLLIRVARKICEVIPSRSIRIMEVCGTHTQNFFRFGLKELLPEKLHFISGPGCPVCVSDQSYIDAAILISREKDTIIASFGDMLRVPGTHATLEKQRAAGADIRVLYSCWDVLRVAQENPQCRVVFLGVGFETTAPTIALTILAAHKKKIRNLFFLTALKLIPPAMRALLLDSRVHIDGFLCPGHVSAIIGAKAYRFIPRTFRKGCCIAGFEPLDILEGIYFLIRQIQEGKPRVDNQYIRLVTDDGNSEAISILKKVFSVTDAVWRGLGKMPDSGLKINRAYRHLDAANEFLVPASHPPREIEKKCRCGDVLKGIISPRDCAAFVKFCRPDKPLGPCMVSQEGACNAYYRYRR
jgi:hydrogenase expression/formation protein HypD